MPALPVLLHCRGGGRTINPGLKNSRVLGAGNCVTPGWAGDVQCRIWVGGFARREFGRAEATWTWIWEGEGGSKRCPRCSSLLRSSQRAAFHPNEPHPCLPRPQNQLGMRSSVPPQFPAPGSEKSRRGINYGWRRNCGGPRRKHFQERRRRSPGGLSAAVAP